jgi:hypothetical protein
LRSEDSGRIFDPQIDNFTTPRQAGFSFSPEQLHLELANAASNSASLLDRSCALLELNLAQCFPVVKHIPGLKLDHPRQLA